MTFPILKCFVPAAPCRFSDELYSYILIISLRRSVVNQKSYFAFLGSLQGINDLAFELPGTRRRQGGSSNKRKDVGVLLVTHNIVAVSRVVEYPEIETVGWALPRLSAYLRVEVLLLMSCICVGVSLGSLGSLLK